MYFMQRSVLCSIHVPVWRLANDWTYYRLKSGKKAQLHGATHVSPPETNAPTKYKHISWNIASTKYANVWLPGLAASRFVPGRRIRNFPIGVIGCDWHGARYWNEADRLPPCLPRVATVQFIRLNQSKIIYPDRVHLLRVFTRTVAI